MKTVRTVVLFTLLLVSCSATPVNRLDNAIIRSIQSVGRVWNRSFEQGMDRFSQGLERFTEGVFTVLSDALSEEINERKLPKPVTPPSSLDEHDLIRSLEEFMQEYPETPLLTLPPDFEFVGLANINWTLRGQYYPLLLIPKSIPPIISGYLPVMDPQQQLNSDFQFVADEIVPSRELPSFPFHPLILVRTRQLDLFSNEVQLPIFLNLTDSGNPADTSIFQAMILRDPFKLPSHPFCIMCITPKKRSEISQTTKASALPDRPDNPAIQPRMVPPEMSTTTLLPFSQTVRTQNLTNPPPL